MVERALRRTVHWVENRWDRARFAVKRRAGWLGTPMILAFHGIAGPDGVWVRGRVLEENGAIGAPPTTSTIQNIRLSIKRYETDEIRKAKVAWRLGEAKGQVVTDEEGYFEFVIPPGADPLEAPWAIVELELIDAPGYDMAPLGAEAWIRVVSDKAEYGVISDIDDTIVKTGAFNFLKHWRTVVANSAESRTAFPGVSEFYRALAKGADGPETHPVFYVSSSPWNLFDLFDRFLTIHEIPRGTMMLKDFGLDKAKWLTGGHDGHKGEMIDQILAACPSLPFLLIGDSGQDDGAIYADAARRYPGRIRQVHIRDVTKGVLKDHITDGIEDLRQSGVTVTLAPTLQAAASAAEKAGYITAGDLRRIENRIGERRAEGSAA
ncbi:MAG: phosphatase domain-containing protein [Pseudomonadota bacterium]|nr:phosphatase domain-containing protein [Pseudomonadota bacterium]